MSDVIETSLVLIGMAAMLLVFFLFGYHEGRNDAEKQAALTLVEIREQLLAANDNRRPTVIEALDVEVWIGQGVVADRKRRGQ